MPGIYPIRPGAQISFAFYVQLRTFREAAGLSQEEMAAGLNDRLAAEQYTANDLQDLEEDLLDPPAQIGFYTALFQVLELGEREWTELVRAAENQLGVELSVDLLSLESLAMFENLAEYSDEEE